MALLNSEMIYPNNIKRSVFAIPHLFECFSHRNSVNYLHQHSEITRNLFAIKLRPFHKSWQLRGIKGRLNFWDSSHYVKESQKRIITPFTLVHNILLIVFDWQKNNIDFSLFFEAVFNHLCWTNRKHDTQPSCLK